MFKRIIHTIESSILCLRFPFLYPRNRFTGRGVEQKWFLKSYYKIDDELKDEARPWRTMVLRAKRVMLMILHKVDIIGRLPRYTELDRMPKGWRIAFGIDMCRDMKRALKKLPREVRRTYRIMDIKEKFGILHWYDNFSTFAIDYVKTYYEDLSWYTCIECGEPATYITKGWIMPLCGKCSKKLNKNVVHIDDYDDYCSSMP